MYKIEDYSPKGIPNLFGYSDKKCRVIIDPNIEYFNYVIKNDRIDYDNLILINGCEPLIANQMSNHIKEYGRYFDKIYTYDNEILNLYQHSELFVFGSCWILTDKNNNIIQKQKDYFNNFKIEDKKHKLSFIKSSNDWLPGHRLRHIVTPHLDKKYDFEVNFPKHRIETKIELFTDSMFHLCIENSQQGNYFTEKIVDCFMSYTIPIYWGCTNIGDFFDINGIIIVNSYEEIIDVLNNLKEDDYIDRIESIKNNYQICVDKKYAFFFDRVNDLVNK